MPEPRPAKHEDVAKEKARDLGEPDCALFSLKGVANNWPSGPEYAALRQTRRNDDIRRHRWPT